MVLKLKKFDPNMPFLDLEVDPKLSWALRHLDQFPVNFKLRIIR
jgi:predicted DNA-binding helix-hairpin-helix protein